MKTIKIGINGFGRIGRCILRAVVLNYSNVEVVAINDPFLTAEYAKYMLIHDTVHGKFQGKVDVNNDELIVNGKAIKFYAEYEPENIPWGQCGADYVCEATGKFTKLLDAQRHLKSGAKKVIVTAPGKEMPLFVYGVNHMTYNGSNNVVSNASCTTNCLAPLAKVLEDNFGIEEALMSTIHSTTASQLTVDGPSKKDWRGGRSAMANIIPSSTGAAKSVGVVIPSLNGKLTGMSFRVPTINVSVVDLTLRTTKKTTLQQINEVIKNASETTMQGIIEYCEDMAVSSDFVGNFHTCIFDSLAGLQIGDNFFKLVAWYDNEWGYSMKTVDLIVAMNKIDKF